MEHWKKYWKKQLYSPLQSTPHVSLYGGTHYEPLASIGMSCFLDAVRYKFKENFSIIDYGCGAGILSNFISSRLKNFSYIGLEPLTSHGIERIELGKKYFNNPRVKFGFTNEYQEYIKGKIDAIILISVFTHMIFDDIRLVLNDLIKIFDYNPDSTIVFSCFIEEKPRVILHQPQIWDRFYSESYITLNDLETYCHVANLKLEKHIEFIAQGGYKHQIFKINKL